jgi:hypothetical protein
MPDTISDLRSEFSRLAVEAKAVFELVERRHAVYIDSRFPPHLSDEQRAWVDDVRRRVRGLLARLACPLQQSPLLNKHDFQRFVLLGRAMDAALGFKSYRGFGMENSDDTPCPSWIFKDACKEIAELLDFIPGFAGLDKSPASPDPPASSVLQAAAERSTAERDVIDEERAQIITEFDRICAERKGESG